MPCYNLNMDAIPHALLSVAPGALSALCQRFRVRQLDLFGSATDGRFDAKRSDLDFLVAFEELPERAYADAYFGLREGLAGLFGREIDLLTEPALENPYLRRRVEMQKRRLFPPA